MTTHTTRRGFVLATSGAAGGVFLVGCGAGHDAAEDVSATEDLMREHGVLRRALLVYRDAATRLRDAAGATPPLDALARTAKLFRTFGEDYHERKLEEAVIFPAVRRVRGPAASAPDVLLAQHQRGRDITDIVLSTARRGSVGAGGAALAQILDGFVRMYEAHMAIEDTVVFPAWKTTLSSKQLDETSERFEAIERATFGKDGFAAAVAEIESIETAFGIADLAAYTAPPPSSV